MNACDVLARIKCDAHNNSKLMRRVFIYAMADETKTRRTKREIKATNERNYEMIALMTLFDQILCGLMTKQLSEWKIQSI